MKIIICDDNLEDLSSIEELLKQYMQDREITGCQIEIFSDPSVLFEKIEYGGGIKVAHDHVGENRH